MYVYKPVGLLALFVTGICAGYAEAQSGGCSTVTIDSVSRSTFAQSYKYKKSAVDTSSGIWKSTLSVTDPAARLNNNKATAEQMSEVYGSDISVVVEASASSLVSASTADSRCEVEFTVAGTEVDSEFTASLFRPIAMELDLYLEASKLEEGASDQALVHLYNSGGDLIFEDDIEGVTTRGDSESVTANFELWPGTYTLVVVARASTQPGKLRRKAGSWPIVIVPNAVEYRTLARVNIDFMENAAPGSAMVELISQEREASASTNSSSDLDSDTNACYTNLSASASGAASATANQESQMRSSAFWGGLEASASSPTVGDQASAQSHMQAEFEISSTTDVSIDMYVYFDVDWSSAGSISSGGITGSIVNSVTGLTEWSYSQIISSPMVFDDYPYDSITLGPGRYELVLSVSADARRSHFLASGPSAQVYLSPFISFD